MMLRTGTICFLRKEAEVLLAQIEYNPTNTKWGGVGGMADEGESPEDAVVRELREELNIGVAKEDLEHVAVIHESNKLILYIYTTRKWEGTPEMKDPTIKQLKWFVPATIPYEQMWKDNMFWLPEILVGKKIKVQVMKDIYTDIKPLTEKDLEIMEVAEFNPN